MAYFMNDMTVKEMEEAMIKTKTVIIPVGCVEQHGYHLPLSTDYHNANELPLRAGDRLNAFIAPIVPYSYSGGELLGTVNVSPQVFALYIMDIFSEFVRMGFDNLILLIGHGGTENTAEAELSLKMMLKRHPHMRDKVFALVVIPYLSPTWMEIFNTSPEHDYHAGLAETSLMMYWKPELVKDEIVMDEPDIAAMLRTDPDWYSKSDKLIDNEFVIPFSVQRKEVRVGVMGFPEKATREIGEKICNEAVDGLVNLVDHLNKTKKATEVF